MTRTQVDSLSALGGEFPPADMSHWHCLIDKALKGGDFDRRLVGRTADGVRIEPVFTQRVVSGWGDPGSEFGRGWDIRQLQTDEDPAVANAAILEDLAGGATSITLQIATSGWSGLASSEAAIGRALDGVLLDVCPVALRAGERTLEAAASLMTVWKARGLSAEQRRGAFDFDPLGRLAETGLCAAPLAVSLAQSASLMQAVQDWPHVTALRADGHVWHAAGASEAQELAAVLSELVAYLKAAEAEGIAPPAALPKIVINLAVDTDQLMGLAKLRAARRLVARIAAACGAADAVAAMAFTAETSRTMMTRRDPWVNMLRTSMACATAAWGGADSVTVLPYTWALGQPDSFARRMARNTSLVLMEESGLGRVSDPASGSFAIETLTADLEKAAWLLFQKIESEGGLAAALANGRLQSDVARTAVAKAAAVALGSVPLTGISAFPRLGDDGVVVKPWPSPIREPANDVEGVTVTALRSHHPSGPFEMLRDKADALALSSGNVPSVFLACLGPLSGHAARATWMSNFLAAGGISSIQSPPLLQSSDAGQAFVASGGRIVCLCAADATYAEIGDATISLLKTAGAAKIFVAGRPKAAEASLKEAGADAFIYSGCNMVETLTALQVALADTAS